MEVKRLAGQEERGRKAPGLVSVVVSLAVSRVARGAMAGAAAVVAGASSTDVGSGATSVVGSRAIAAGRHDVLLHVERRT